MEIEFNNLEETHHCTSHIEGDWIVWRCPHCIGYERRLNMRSGKMRVKGKTDVRHQGSNSGNTNVVKPLTKNICQN